jgi:hypothetical protein
MRIVGLVCTVPFFAVILIGGAALAVTGLLERYETFPVLRGIVLVVLLAIGLFFLGKASLIDRTRVCAVVDRQVRTSTGGESGPMKDEVVLTRDCGTLHTESTEIYAGLEPGHSYRLRYRGLRWFADPIIYRNEGRVRP